MANRNDFKLLRQRCIRHFELAKDCLNAEKKTLTDDQKARYGFYFFVIQNLTNIEEYDEIAGAITDMEFNSSFFGDGYKMKVLMLSVSMIRVVKFHCLISNIETILMLIKNKAKTA